MYYSLYIQQRWQFPKYFTLDCRVTSNSSFFFLWNSFLSARGNLSLYDKHLKRSLCWLSSKRRVFSSFRLNALRDILLKAVNIYAATDALHRSKNCLHAQMKTPNLFHLCFCFIFEAVLEFLEFFFLDRNGFRILSWYFNWDLLPHLRNVPRTDLIILQFLGGMN
jgi:hypothetical protein